MFDLIELCSTKRSYFTCKKTRVTIMWASLRSALRLKRANSFINEREKEGGKEQKKQMCHLKRRYIEDLYMLPLMCYRLMRILVELLIQLRISLR